MADYSKQWCDINDPDMPYDFDIEVEAETLEPGYGIHMICEGFGFTMIAKDDSGSIQLGFPDSELQYIEWVPYLQFIQQQKSSL